MKRILSIITVALVCLTASAQKYVGWCDEIEMLGDWQVESFAGDFVGFPSEYKEKTPVAFQFRDGNYTTVNYDGETWIFKGYWITTAKTNECYLHLLPWNGGQSIVNFKIQHFDNGFMVLRTYDGAGRIELKKNTSAGVRAIVADSLPNRKAYGLNGIKLPDTAKGIAIQGGKKILR
ncbi:MAG: hypothetical protein J5658_04885 [Prevotella sp.]|nr:hypothetical protein [Prevotella sp.]